MISSFVTKHDRQVHRFLEILLGFLTWSLLTSPAWLGVIYPQAIVFLLTFLTVYWSYLALKHSWGLYQGYVRYKDELKQDWLAKCRELDFSALPDKPTLPPSLKEVKHLIVLPAYSEPEDCLSMSVDSILAQTFPSDQVVLVFTVEEKYHEVMVERIEKVVGERAPRLHKFMVFVHPAGIEGEAKGDGGANRTWGARHAVEQLTAQGENLRYYIFSNLDSDHVLHPQYLARLTYAYLTTDKRDNHFYSSAVPLFNNNLWRVPTMMRIEANAVTLGVISDWGASKSSMKKTFSAFSTSLQTLIDADYFNVYLGADDTIFYWRAFIARNGDFEGVPYFIPYSADAVEGKNYIDSYRSLYKQLLRWGWGAIDFPLSMKEFLKNEKIKFSKKLMWSFRHLKERVFLVNIVFLITFGFGIVTLVNPYVKQSNFAYSLPNSMSAILTLTLIFLIPSTYFRLKFADPMPSSWPIWKKVLVFLEGPLIMLNLLTYSFFPWIDAQTRIMLGKKMKDLYHTPKVR